MEYKSTLYENASHGAVEEEQARPAGMDTLFTLKAEMDSLFDVSPDGRHFLLTERAEREEPAARFSVVEGVADYVRARLGR